MKIKVGQTVYDVKYEETERENGNYGATYHKISRINIDPGVSDGERRDTLLHEVLHTCAHFAGIGEEDRLSEEEFISRTTPILLNVLCENPHLVKEICPDLGLKL